MNTYFMIFALVLGYICSVTYSEGINQSPSSTAIDALENSCPGVCRMKPDAGTVNRKPRFRRWYYSSESNECLKFSYGGRGGNGNRFMEKEECEAQCGTCNSEMDKSDICILHMDPGLCDSGGVVPLLLWYFDHETKTCQRFAYSGCGGNENKFDSEVKCEEKCKD